MSIIKNGATIGEVNINGLNISKIYYGNILVYSSEPKIAGVVFRDIDENGNLTLATGSINELFDNVKTISNYGLYYAFYNCTGITGNVSFPALTTVYNSGLRGAFYGCTGITGNVSFPALTTVYNSGLDGAFYNCKGITGNVSFPKLTSIGSRGLSNAFYGCTGITEIHFRADAQSVIEAQYGYSSKFGATNATIYFDL